jgi:hypothetical protein
MSMVATYALRGYVFRRVVTRLRAHDRLRRVLGPIRRAGRKAKRKRR